MTKPKVGPPPARLTKTRADLVTIPTSQAIWRISNTAGEHVLAWNQPRAHGPLRTMRWDPHHPPRADHPTRAVWYGSPTLTTVVAERFQADRTVDPLTGAPHLHGCLPRRPLRLLDLTGDWPLRHGASFALNAAPKVICRAWAAAILDAWPDLDGLQAASTLDGRPTFVLFPHGAAALPARPQFSQPLTQPDAFAAVHAAARAIGYAVLPPF